MNKHLLQTRLRSLAHYGDEILKLTQAIKATEATREEILQSLKEFWPFAEGDIIVCKGQIISVIEVTAMCDYINPQFKIKHKYHRKEYSRSVWETAQDLMYLPIADLEKVKKIEIEL